MSALSKRPLPGGISTGRTVSDTCELRRNLPETAPLNPYCRQVTPYLTQVKLLGAYTIPRVDVQVSATFQSVPGPQLAANINFPSAAIAPSLGRPLSGNQAVADQRRSSGHDVRRSSQSNRFPGGQGIAVR